MVYAVQYTISVLTGAYAQKYSVIVYDAARLAGLLEATDSELVGFADDAEKREYEPYACFQALMKIIKKYSKKKFCTSIERIHDGESEHGVSFKDEDAQGPCEVRAHGLKGQCIRSGVSESFEELEGTSGTYRAHCERVLDHFKVDLENLLNLCEETIAKDGRLLAQTVPNDTPAPLPLFRL